MVGWLISNLFSYRPFLFLHFLQGNILQCGGEACVLTSHDDLRAPFPGSHNPSLLHHFTHTGNFKPNYLQYRQHSSWQGQKCFRTSHSTLGELDFPGLNSSLHHPFSGPRGCYLDSSRLLSSNYNMGLKTHALTYYRWDQRRSFTTEKTSMKCCVCQILKMET